MKRAKSRKTAVSRRAKSRSTRQKQASHARRRARPVRRQVAKRQIRSSRLRRSARPKIVSAKRRAPSRRSRIEVMQTFKVKKPELSSLERAFEGSQTTPARQLATQPNMIVTFDPNKTASAKAEVERLLRDINETARIEESAINGIFKLTVSDPKSIVKKMVEMCKNTPEKFNRTFHWTPVDRWCKTNISEMQEIVKDLAGKISENESWKMTIEKRQCDEHERELITKLTGVVNRDKVDLKDPDKIIRIDIMGDETGISVLSREEYLNVTRFRR